MERTHSLDILYIQNDINKKSIFYANLKVENIQPTKGRLYFDWVSKLKKNVFNLKENIIEIL